MKLLLVALSISMLMEWAECVPKSLQTVAKIKLTSLTSSLTLLSSSLITGVASASAAAASGARAEFEKDEFRARYPYARPSDFIDYIEDVGEEGNFESVLRSAYRFSSVYPMYGLSEEKSKFLASKVKNRHSMLEIGTFYGFSTCFMLRAMPRDCTLTCIEGNEENIAVAKAVVEKAFGKGNEVLQRWKIIPGLSTDVLKRSSREELTRSPNKNFDFVFLDHDKSFLLPDTQILENRKLLSETATIVADNVIFPGAPSFLEYMNAPGVPPNSPSDESVGSQFEWETKLYPFPFERVGFETGYKVKDDAMSVSTRRMQS